MIHHGALVAAATGLGGLVVFLVPLHHRAFIGAAGHLAIFHFALAARHLAVFVACAHLGIGAALAIFAAVHGFAVFVFAACASLVVGFRSGVLCCRLREERYGEE